MNDIIHVEMEQQRLNINLCCMGAKSNKRALNINYRRKVPRRFEKRYLYSRNMKENFCIAAR